MAGCRLLMLGLIGATVGALASARASAAIWEIPGIDIELVVLDDRSVRVTEVVHVNFGAHGCEGIDLAVPRWTFYPWTGMLELRIGVLAVESGKREPLPYRIDETPYDTVIRIRHPGDVQFVGEMIYRIEYRVDGAVVTREDRDFLSWAAVTGTWDAGIFGVNVVIQLPGEIDPNEVKVQSFTGFFDERGRAAELQATEPGRAVVRLLRGLKAHERLTVQASWPAPAPSAPPMPRTGASELLTWIALIVSAAALAISLLGRRRP